MSLTNRYRGVGLRQLLGAVLLITTLAACSLGTTRDIEIRPAPIQSFRLTAQSGLSFTFEVTAEWPNTCGSFAQFDTNREGNTFAVEIFGRQPVGAICGQAITPFTGVWNSNVPTAGVYTFQFLRESLAPLDTMVTFTAVANSKANESGQV